jgi:nicotinamidase-related amidase
MATVRAGNKPVLMIVDVQVGVVAKAWQPERAIEQMVKVVDKARAAGVPLVWVQHNSDEYPEGSATWQWMPALQPREGEKRVHKRYNSAFEETTAEAILAGLGASHIVLMGAMSGWCIRATAYGALERGYDLTLVSDAHTTGTLQLGDGTSIEAESVIRDLNVAIQWLRYPGRNNRVVTAEALNFAACVAP